MLVLRPLDGVEDSGFYPLFNEQLVIIGTQFINKKQIIIKMPNFEREEWNFMNDVTMSGYKLYYNDGDLDEDCLLLQANLAEVINFRPGFNESDHIMILKYQIRFLMNMVPFILDQAMFFELNESNFLQPNEMMDGKSICEIMLDDHNSISDNLKLMSITEREKKSLFEFFIQELNEQERESILAEDHYIPSQLEVSRD
jgi:hypothetical protein